MVFNGFQVVDKLGKAWFFQVTFLLTETNMEVILKMPFFILNNKNIIMKNWYLLTLISEYLDWLRQPKRFIYRDLTSVYYLKEIKESDKWTTTFRNYYGHFKYQFMFFVLLNASTSFWSYINKILVEKLEVFIWVYLDDIQIYIQARTLRHVEAICSMLDQLKKNSFFANLKKCLFHKDDIHFLAYVMSAKKVEIECKRNEVAKNELKSK